MLPSTSLTAILSQRARPRVDSAPALREHERTGGAVAGGGVAPSQRAHRQAKAVVHARVFVVLRPPADRDVDVGDGGNETTPTRAADAGSPDNRSVLRDARAAQALAASSHSPLRQLSRRLRMHRERGRDGWAWRTLHSHLAASAGRSSEASFAGHGGAAAGLASGADDDVARDDDAEDVADEAWGRHALAVIPLVLTVPLATATAADIMQAAWPYVVELWRDQGRYWPAGMVPDPLPASSAHFALRMLGPQWADPPKQWMRACVEPPPSVTLAGFDPANFKSLLPSLIEATFRERALLPSAPLRLILPRDPGSSAALASNLNPFLARMLRVGAPKSATDAHHHNQQRHATTNNAAASSSQSTSTTTTLPQYRLTLLLTLSNDYLQREQLALTELRTRAAVLAAVCRFFDDLKRVELASLRCAAGRTAHRLAWEGAVRAVVTAEDARRERVLALEADAFANELQRPFERVCATLLPVLRASHAIRVAWRTRLADDIARARDEITRERRSADGVD